MNVTGDLTAQETENHSRDCKIAICVPAGELIRSD